MTSNVVERTARGDNHLPELADSIRKAHAARQAQNRRNPRGAREARSRLRRQRLVEYLHQLGPAPLYHFLTEVERGAPLWRHVERYAALPAAFIKANGGDQFAPLVHVIDGGES
jgi:hypothetical protein